MTESSPAVFLSYASQDAEAAQRICESLRAAGIEVWFDQSELRGGDVWDQKIRRQIRDCALFIAVVSANTAARHEGYFRLEWDLADQRSHRMARNRVFIVPVCPGDTAATTADVPESFQRVQWTRVAKGETPTAFAQHVKRLLSHDPSTASSTIETSPPKQRAGAFRRSRFALLAALTVVIVTAVAYLAIDTPWISKPAPPAAFNPPPHSIAVLPFLNLSGDKDQEYFSDGLSEELLNALAEIEGLQVAARTSAFSFKGQDNDIGTIAHKLNVGAILEGSVRRSANTIRITAQLINAVTGFHLWSKSYDRDLGDVLKLQTEIATAVASALKVTLLGDVAAKVELGGTRNPAAFNAYLWGAKLFGSRHESKEIPAAIAAYTEAIQLDPHYALVFAARSLALSGYTADAATGAAIREGFDKAQADARQAISLAPDLAQGHLALARVAELGNLDFTQASESYERALALAPGNAQVLRSSGSFAVNMGNFEAGLASIRRAVALDPLARSSHTALGRALYSARQYDEAIAAWAKVISLELDFKSAYADRGFAYYGLGDLQSARASCETTPDYWASRQCLAVIYDKLKQHADAEAQLAKLKAALGESAAYQYTTIYAQWGNAPKALDWLDTALRLRDPGLVNLKTDPLMDPLRQEPRFQAVMRELKFPTAKAQASGRLGRFGANGFQGPQQLSERPPL